jgi:drug/metabolite transporter (DMT)-like permease
MALRYLTPAELLAWSALVSTAILFAFCVATGSRRFRIRGRDWLNSALLGMINPFLYYTVLFEAYNRLQAQEAQALNYTWAIVLTLLSAPLLGQKLRSRDLFAVGIGFLGALTIAVQGDFRTFHPRDSLGVVLALGSSLFWALYWILNLRDDRDALPKLTLNFMFGTLFSFVVLGLVQGIRIPDWRGLAGASYVGLFEMGITFVLWLTALKRSPDTARVSVLIYLTPFLSLILIHQILGEPVRWPTLAGLGLIVVGILSRGVGGANQTDHVELQ